MSFDRSRKKPQDYRVPAGRQRCAPAFADSDRLMIDGQPLCPSIATGPVAAAPAPPPVAPTPPAPGAAQRLRALALPVLCLLVGLTLGLAIGRVTAPEALAPALQHEAPATPPSMTDGDGHARPGAEHPTAEAASQAGSP